MAGERKGKAYEAVILVALEELRAERVVRYPMVWRKDQTGDPRLKLAFRYSKIGTNGLFARGTVRR